MLLCIFFGDTSLIFTQWTFFFLVHHSLMFTVNGNIDNYSTGECRKKFDWVRIKLVSLKKMHNNMLCYTTYTTTTQLCALVEVLYKLFNSAHAQASTLQPWPCSPLWVGLGKWPHGNGSDSNLWKTLREAGKWGSVVAFLGIKSQFQ